MPRRSLSVTASLIATFLLLQIASAILHTDAANVAATPRATVRLSGGEKCFEATGKCMHGIFLGYWQSYGGVAQLGYPITDELLEDGRTVQYTERARLEWHQQFRDTQNEVLLSLLGTQLIAGRNDASFRKIGASSTGAFFAQTGHSLREPFLPYWQARGGLPVFGYPISEAFSEKSQSD